MAKVKIAQDEMSWHRENDFASRCLFTTIRDFLNENKHKCDYVSFDSHFLNKPVYCF